MRRRPRNKRRLKKLAETVAAAHKAHPKARIEVWAFDEHRIGLKPISRRVWAPTGQRPITRGAHRYQWLYLYAFVQPSKGEVVWFLFNTVNAAAFQETLKAFAREIGAGKDKIVIVVIDNAGWHISDDITPPHGVALFFQPPYTPELQPAERLWPLTNEAVANRSIETLEALAETLERRCLGLCQTADTIKSHTLFSWWPNPS